MSKRPRSATIVAACTQRIRSLGSYVALTVPRGGIRVPTRRRHVVRNCSRRLEAGPPQNVCPSNRKNSTGDVAAVGSSTIAPSSLVPFS